MLQVTRDLLICSVSSFSHSSLSNTYYTSYLCLIFARKCRVTYMQGHIGFFAKSLDQRGKRVRFHAELHYGLNVGVKRCERMCFSRVMFGRRVTHYASRHILTIFIKSHLAFHVNNRKTVSIKHIAVFHLLILNRQHQSLI